MNNITLIIIIIFLVIIVIKLLSIRKYEHLTPQSDEAIQNLANMYNKDQVIFDNVSAKNTQSENIDTKKIKIGDWTITTCGNNLCFYNQTGKGGLQMYPTGGYVFSPFNQMGNANHNDQFWHWCSNGSSFKCPWQK